MNEITRNPLCWPDSVPRTAPHLRGNPRFCNRSLAVSADFVLQEINRLNGRWHGYEDGSVIISSNLRLKADGTPYSQQGEPADTGGNPSTWSRLQEAYDQAMAQFRKVAA